MKQLYDRMEMRTKPEDQKFIDRYAKKLKISKTKFLLMSAKIVVQDHLSELLRDIEDEKVSK